MDSNLENKKSFIADHCKTFPMFSQIEISPTNQCNRHCSFCPRPDENISISFMNMIEILNQLKTINYDGLITFSGMGEPLLHKYIGTFIMVAGTTNAIVELITNGDMVDEEMITFLFECGLDRLIISVYEKEKLLYFQELRGCLEIILRPRWNPEMFELNNRGGAMKPLSSPLKLPCYYPFYMMMIDENGKVYPCSNNYRKRYPIANTSYESLLDIWMGQKMRDLRLKLLKGDRNNPLCKECDVKGYLIGQEHFEAWRKYYAETRNP